VLSVVLGGVRVRYTAIDHRVHDRGTGRGGRGAVPRSDRVRAADHQVGLHDHEGSSAVDRRHWQLERRRRAHASSIQHSNAVRVRRDLAVVPIATIAGGRAFDRIGIVADLTARHGDRIIVATDAHGRAGFASFASETPAIAAASTGTRGARRARLSDIATDRR